MTFRLCLLFYLFLGILQAEEFAYFVPPQDWKVIETPSSEPTVKLSFIGKAYKQRAPVINLATEKTSVSLKEYVSIIQANCKADPNREWQDLGAFLTPAGEGRLMEISFKKEESRQLQLALIKNNTAYVVTTCCSKETFAELSQIFYTVLKSFTLTSNLIESVKQKDARERLEKLCAQILQEKKFQKKTWSQLEKTILKNYSEMGNYWKILLLKDIRDKFKNNQE